MTKKIDLDVYQAAEVNNMIKELQQHKEKYKCFVNYCKNCDDALTVAHALLNNDYKTFKKYQLKYTTHTAAKMRGIESLNTYKKYSSICNYMQLHDSICKKCYADKSIKLYQATLKPLLIYNTLLLKYIDIDPAQIPYINNKYFRFESFSDLQGSKHLKNLIQVCKKNKNTLFTLWSKAGITLNNMLLQEGVKKLPSNLNIIYSEPKINNKVDNNYKEYINHIQVNINTGNKIKCFIVYDSAEAQKNSGLYQCKNNCISCLKCYKKSKDIIYIAEKIH